MLPVVFYGFCRKNGLNSLRGIEYISDGAGWLRTIAEDVFPEAEKSASWRISFEEGVSECSY